MSGGGGRQQCSGAGGGDSGDPPVSKGFVLVAAPDQHSPSSPRQRQHKHMAAFSNSGISGESLLCTETLTARSPPADDVQPPAISPGDGPARWRGGRDVQVALIVPESLLASHPHLLASHPQLLAQAALLTSSSSSLSPDPPGRDDGGARPVKEVGGPAQVNGHSPDPCPRRLLGSAVLVPSGSSSKPAQYLLTLPRSPPQPQPQPQSPPGSEREGGMPRGRGAGPSASRVSPPSPPSPHSEPRAMLSSSPLYRATLDPSAHRAAAGCQGAAGQFSGTAAGMAGYSMYSVPSQSSPLASYPGFFSQYPQSAGPHYSPSPSLLSPGRFPHIESYSAVLASMGSHLQHAGHAPPATRAPYLPSPFPHRSLSAASSPTPSGPAPSFSARDREALLQQQQQQQHQQGERERSPPQAEGDKGLLHLGSRPSPPEGVKGGEGRAVPSGKEGSLKHRILTRPPDGSKARSQSLKASDDDGTAAKRARYLTPSLGAAPPASPPDPHVFLAPHALPSPSASHYPHHHNPTTNSNPTPSAPFLSHSTTVPSSSPSSASPNAHPHPSSPPESVPVGGPSPQLHYPPHFVKGSIIQLANGDLKRVEDLQTEDFVSSAHVSADLKVDSSTVVRIDQHPDQGTATLGFSVGEHRVQVTVEATLEHPFFVFGQGWSSCCAQRSLQRYGLPCHRLSVGDVCISLTHKDVALRAREILSSQHTLAKDSPLQHHDPAVKDAGEGHGQGNGVGSGSGGQSDVVPSAGRDCGGLNGGGEDGGSSSNSSLPKGRKGSGGSRPLSHAQSADGGVAWQGSSPEAQSPSDSRPPRKRRWSAPESDVDKDKGEAGRDSGDTPAQA